MEKTYNLTIATPFENIATLMQIAEKDKVVRRDKVVYAFNTVTDRYEYATSLDSAKFERYMEDNNRDVAEGRTPTYQAKLTVNFASEDVVRDILLTALKSKMRIIKINYSENP